MNVLKKISMLSRRTSRKRHRTKSTKRKTTINTPENVKLREEAAARCTAKIKRRTLRKQARVRAEHLVKCSLEPRKQKTPRKPLTELSVKAHFTEDREEWQKELERPGGNRKVESNISGRKEINNLRRKVAARKSRLAWCCKLEPR